MARTIRSARYSSTERTSLTLRQIIRTPPSRSPLPMGTATAGAICTATRRRPPRPPERVITYRRKAMLRPAEPAPVRKGKGAPDRSIGSVPGAVPAMTPEHRTGNAWWWPRNPGAASGPRGPRAPGRAIHSRESRREVRRCGTRNELSYNLTAIETLGAGRDPPLAHPTRLAFGARARPLENGCSRGNRDRSRVRSHVRGRRREGTLTFTRQPLYRGMKWALRDASESEAAEEAE